MAVIDTSDKKFYPVCVQCPESWTEFNEDWIIGMDGHLVSTRSGYDIVADELGKGHWFVHLMEKRWFDANTFLPAYFEACRRAGIKSVTIQTGY